MRKRGLGHRHTLAASYTGYIIHAIANNFLPLLFVTFTATYGISIEKITVLIVINFGTQLVVDLLFSKLADKIGYRRCIIFAHAAVVAGFAMLAILPEVMDAYAGLILAVFMYGMGGGLLEVVLSPIVEASPTAVKSSGMSLLHSFYCWGAALAVLVSTVVFWVFGTECWRILALAWMALPVINGIYFCFVPIYTLESTEESRSFSHLFKQRTFWIFMIIMLCAGAAEVIFSQWSSTFAEIGLDVSKEFGDLAGPFAFALLMGVSRVTYSIISTKLPLKVAIIGSGGLCVCSFLLAALSPIPVLSLVGCALAGLSVGVLCPGILSLAAEKMPGGGTPLFALLALAGDTGCSLGPLLVGLVSSAYNENISIGLLFGIIFPIILLIAMTQIASTAPRR